MKIINLSLGAHNRLKKLFFFLGLKKYEKIVFIKNEKHNTKDDAIQLDMMMKLYQNNIGMKHDQTKDVTRMAIKRRTITTQYPRIGKNKK